MHYSLAWIRPCKELLCSRRWKGGRLSVAVGWVSAFFFSLFRLSDAALRTRRRRRPRWCCVVLSAQKWVLAMMMLLWRRLLWWWQRRAKDLPPFWFFNISKLSQFCKFEMYLLFSSTSCSHFFLPSYTVSPTVPWQSKSVEQSAFLLLPFFFESHPGHKHY